ncbi:rhodanese-like domain-containing protein [Dyadobacter chenwenxiniae]|uniref:Rhodanese-like domain-containing protein n=1 Tax=Dyadobacter chenwenxiniae TaxID=2906456 RepID=A0A9X1PL32_9BACT|nr:rhodanese-like domain-containing protein [Dyadobacter chenwenxiniae]MCF0063382.1 rhodanese-like domain-containing protein [Dyadobacter chenwenxiniae]UON85239.1 rhodanese-like domain-containing protein [Dyadobacter chenwenxiniae]
MMKSTKQFLLIFSFILLSLHIQAQTKEEPWTESQLMPTSELAALIENPDAAKPLIINIGPQAVIKGSVDVGPGKEKDNIKKLEKMLSKEKKDREVILYCGCCPFDKCPNIRPAFSLIKEKGFAKAKLLNVPKNIKTNWIDAGYPVN